MFFDLEPKEHATELFGRDAEVDEIVHLLKAKNWVVVLGPRMVGKTSLVKVALNELTKQNKWRSLYVNFSGISSLSSATKLLVERIGESKTFLAALKEKISDTRGFSIGPGGVSWSGGGEPAHSFRHILSNLAGDRSTTVLFFDEIQELSTVSFQLLKILKNVWDTKAKRLLFVFSGSKFGMLRAMEKETAMSGRPPAEIRLRPFDSQTSAAFLRAGAAEHGKNLSETQLSLATRELDGIVGWLTLFGNYFTVQKKGFENAMRLTEREGRKIAVAEFKNFAKGRDELLCSAVLKILSSRADFEWAEIKQAAETIVGRTLNNNSFNRTLNELIDGEYVENVFEKEGRSRRYRIIDPLLADALSK